VQLFESGVNGDMAYLVMELVDGPSLDQVLRQGPLTTAETASIGSSLADALAYATPRASCTATSSRQHSHWR